LWTLRQEQLSKILFPIGNLKKTDVRKLAKKFKLPVAEKKDSQGICFLGAVDLKEFLKHYIKSKKGKVINEKGEEIGYHDGAVFHTLGERHGFTITKKNSTDGAYYVIAKDIKKNILIVAQKTPVVGMFPVVGQRGAFVVRQLEQTNWIFGIPEANKLYTVQIRYHGEFLDCQIKILSKDKAEVTFNKFVQVAGGQSCVIYDKDVCLGGGVVV
jgi:tRNA-specific 2-thiouridylase